MNEISWEDFEKVKLRVGTVVKVEDFPEARTPAYKLEIDFGEEIGIKRSSSQLKDHHSTEDLMGRQVLGVINFPEKQIGKFMSQVLTTGIYKEDKTVVLLSPDQTVPNGSKLL